MWDNLPIFLKRFYLFLRERDSEKKRERAQAGEVAGRGRRRSRLPPIREPDVGLDPRTLGS